MSDQSMLKPTIMKSHNFIAVGADTDGIAFKKPDQSDFSNEERDSILAGLNDLMDDLIKWEDDGLFKYQIVIKAKNYILVDEHGKQKIKGSALKATTKEKALQRFIKEIIQLLVTDKVQDIPILYFKYAKEILTIKDMTEWCSKKTITNAVLTNDRTNEVRVRDALKGRSVQEGDKIYVFFKTETELSMLQDFNGVYDVHTLLRKLYDTTCIFETVFDIKQIPNLTLKRNKEILTKLYAETSSSVGELNS